MVLQAAVIVVVVKVQQWKQQVSLQIPQLTTTQSDESMNPVASHRLTVSENVAHLSHVAPFFMFFKPQKSLLDFFVGRKSKMLVAFSLVQRKPFGLCFSIKCLFSHICKRTRY